MKGLFTVSPCGDTPCEPSCSDTSGKSPCSAVKYQGAHVEFVEVSKSGVCETLPVAEYGEFICQNGTHSYICNHQNVCLSAEDKLLVEAELSEVCVSLTTKSDAKADPVFDVYRWGNFGKCLRVIAWIFRFIFNLKQRSQKQSQNCKFDDLTYTELSTAKNKLFVFVQAQAYESEIELLKCNKTVPKSSSICKLSPFIGEDGLMRVGSRLQYADLSYDEKFPILLPKGHVALLIIRYHHELMKHAGVNLLIASLRCH